jgi:molybdopterin-guanine dinucleotide biosynthesis protein A
MIPINSNIEINFERKNLNRITGIILAGGISKRMGTDKRLLEFQGKSFLENAYGLLKPFCEKVFISGNEIEGVNFSFIPDRIQNAGPMGGIYSGLEFIQTDLMLVIPVDLPLLTSDVIEYLVNNHHRAFDATVYRFGKHVQPLVGMYDKRILPVIDSKIQNRDYKMQSLFDEIKTQFLDKKNFERYFFNVNTPEQYRKINPDEA